MNICLKKHACMLCVVKVVQVKKVNVELDNPNTSAKVKLYLFFIHSELRNSLP